MKILAVYDIPESDDEEGSMLVWPDSTLVRSGKPVFMPDFPSGCVIAMGIGIKIARLGKSITNRFSSRYYNEVTAIALVVSAANAEAMSQAYRAIDPNYAADYSVVCGNFILKEEFFKSGKIDIKASSERGECISNANWYESDFPHTLNSAIEFASRHNTLKTGDIVVALNPNLCIPSIKNGRIEISIGETSLLNFKMK